MLFGDAGRVMARSASGLHFGLNGSGRKRFAWGAGRLRARQNDGCKQKDCRKNFLEHGESLSQFSVLSSQFSVLIFQFSVLSSQNWICFLVLWIRDFLVKFVITLLGKKILPLPLVEHMDGFENRITYDFEAFGA